MRFARLHLFSLPLAMAVLQSGSTRADTVYLKNGNAIEGQVTDNRATSGEVVIRIGENGWTMLRAGEVDRIEAGAPSGRPAPASTKAAAEPAPAMERGRVSVTAPAGADWYGNRVYEGVVLPESTDKMIVLEIPGPGKVFIARTPETVVKQLEGAEARPMPAAAGNESEIRTTHMITLKNGRKIAGTVVPTAETEPLKIRVGNLGEMRIPRSDVAEKGIEEVQGSIKLPQPAEEQPAAPAAGGAPPAQPGAPGAQGQAPAAPADREAMKREIRAEIIRELLDAMIEEKMGTAVESAAALPSMESMPANLTNEEIFQIRDAVSELGRQRSRNRVRAENELKMMGKTALPFLAEAAKHPFDLTRRAVQRIVRDIGEPSGAPLAIGALNDPDEQVRMLAGEALDRILPSTIAYDSRMDEAERLAATMAYEELFREYARARARDAIVKSLAER